jgi:CubicO group peptidase (beta-lactamase class C family)
MSLLEIPHKKMELPKKGGLAMCRLLTTLFLLLTSFSIFAEEEPVPQTLDELKTAVEKIQQETKVPAIGIAIVDKTGPVWIAGLGEADTEKHIKADEDTLFRIGSTSKMFVALAILKLVDEGKLSLNDPVRSLIPEIAFENPWEETNPVRVAHLLEHTTGWDDLHIAEYAFSAPDTMTTREGLDYHPDSRRSRWIPGTRHAYCNSGPAVAAYIVEKITGQRFEDYVNEQFFLPLNMTSTSYFKTPTYLAKGATLYTNGKAEPYWPLIMRPSGSINSSAKDMANFVQLFLTRGESTQGRLISELALERMETPHTTPGYEQGIRAGYGLANYTTGYKDLHTAFHGHNGAVFGGFTEMSYLKDQGTGYVLMLNANNWPAFDRISKLIRGYLLKDHSIPPHQPIALPAQFKEMAGYYISISPRQELSRGFASMFGVMRFRTDEHYLYREPLLGGWDSPSKDYAINEHVLIESWTGLPSIAWVEDPLAGRVIQTGADLLRPISAVRAFGWIIVFALLTMFGLFSTLAATFWGIRRWIRKTPMDASVPIRLWPLVATLVLIGWITLISLSKVFLTQMATITPLSVTIFLLTLAYPVIVGLSAFSLYRHKEIIRLRWLYSYACTYTILHILVAGYFLYFGTITIRTWA